MPHFIKAVLTLAFSSCLTFSAHAESIVPAVVAQLADEYIATDSSGPRARQFEDFAAGFFRGFAFPEGGSPRNSDAARAGYARGQRYLVDHPNEMDQIFAGYGYNRVDCIGVWRLGFEVSSFEPVDGSTCRAWLGFLGYATSNVPSPAKDGFGVTAHTVRVVGYLSPPGNYGHMGVYGRSLLALSVRLADG